MTCDKDDIALWPCGTWCFWEDLEDYTTMSDDFEVLPFASAEWEAHVDKECL